MSKVLIEEQVFSDIADSIRAKNSSQDTYKPGQMSAAIDNIPSGGDLETKSVTITENTTTVITPTQGKDGLSQVSVTTDLPPTDIGDYFKDSYGGWGNSNIKTPMWANYLKKIKSPIEWTTTTADYLFARYPGISLPSITFTENITTMKYTFESCYAPLIEFSDWDTSHVTDMAYCLAGGLNAPNAITYDLTDLDTSNVTNFSGFLSNTHSTFRWGRPFIYIGIGNLDTSSAINMSYMFTAFGNDSLQEQYEMLDISNWDTSNVTNMQDMFREAQLGELDMHGLDTSKVTAWGNFIQYSSLKKIDMEHCDMSGYLTRFYLPSYLENFKMGDNFGKNYLTTQSANYYNYGINCSSANNLTHDSLMSIINNIYDIASAGVQPQQLILGATNLAKLDQTTEVSIATTKGWTVS